MTLTFKFVFLIIKPFLQQFIQINNFYQTVQYIDKLVEIQTTSILYSHNLVEGN